MKILLMTEFQVKKKIIHLKQEAEKFNLKINLNKVKIKIEDLEEINMTLKNNRAEKGNKGKKYACQEIIMMMMNQHSMMN